ncbi:MAG: F0F1 ATP synthase subunit epsilon [Candidatus Staskawiczbacteria bacterium]|nr:F0F1 ATP synthase subunit epsilon [Candidatus Staskawiczbacteria bacterium]
MKLSIYSLKNILFQGSAVLLNCQTTTGEITVLDHHETLITVLTAGVIKIIDENKKEQFFPVKSGFLEVKSDNEVRAVVQE